MVRLTIVTHFLIAFGLVSSSTIPASKRNLTNAERLARGLPPNSPERMFNATTAHAAPAKRSDSSQQAYMVAQPYQPTRKRSPAPYNTKSYVFYNTDDQIFSLTTDKTLATLFTLPTTGAGQWVTFFNPVTNNVAYICSSVWSGGYTMKPGANGGSTSTIMYSCPLTPKVSNPYGNLRQQPIWSVPQQFPGDVNTIFYNSDNTITYFPPFWGYSAYGHPYMFGTALSSSDLASADNFGRVTVQWVTSI
ncbi:hypothetical protein M231_07494 [Tremella mesenterica]|uniref:Ubiquitin 3 binding protein But2 C-terminal domain-containing protein n=1 Tax=Tremella mesenterica TaxID=5217 RepID=A0A4V1M310_TREME|nr:hypothetical protein M231_07494 [Tremella mesenterica]